MYAASPSRPVTERRETRRIGEGPLEHPVQRTVGSAGRAGRLHGLDRHVEIGQLHDRLGELEPGALASGRQVEQPGCVLVHGLHERTREVGRVGRAQPLVRHHLELSLLAGAGEHARHEVAALRGAAVQAVETGAAGHDGVRRVRERRVLTGQLGERVDAARGGRRVLRIRVGARCRRTRSWCSCARASRRSRHSARPAA